MRCAFPPYGPVSLFSNKYLDNKIKNPQDEKLVRKVILAARRDWKTRSLKGIRWPGCLEKKAVRLYLLWS
jgi:hypothetical protein